jgi:hypothetical protein
MVRGSAAHVCVSVKASHMTERQAEGASRQ